MVENKSPRVMLVIIYAWIQKKLPLSFRVASSRHFAICPLEHFCFSSVSVGIFLFQTFCSVRIVVCVCVSVVMLCALCFIKIE